LPENWIDLYADGRRINKIIKHLTTKLFNSSNDDQIIKFANSICYLTGKKIELVDKVTGISQYLNDLRHRKGLE
jgi:hypothetical protein